MNFLELCPASIQDVELPTIQYLRSIIKIHSSMESTVKHSSLYDCSLKLLILLRTNWHCIETRKLHRAMCGSGTEFSGIHQVKQKKEYKLNTHQKDICLSHLRLNWNNKNVSKSLQSGRLENVHS